MDSRINTKTHLRETFHELFDMPKILATRTKLLPELEKVQRRPYDGLRCPQELPDVFTIGAEFENFYHRVSILLGHLSRKLIGELIVNEGIRRPSVRPSACQHFQTTSPLKPRSRFFSYFTNSIYRSYFTNSIYRSGNEELCFSFRSDKSSGCYGNL